MTATRVALDDMAWERLDPLLSKKVVDGKRMTLTRYRFGPEGRFPHHVHEQEQVTYVLEGGLTFHLEGTEIALEAGHAIVIPSNVPHSAEAGPAGAEVLSVVSPARTEGRGIEMLEEE